MSARGHWHGTTRKYTIMKCDRCGRLVRRGMLLERGGRLECRGMMAGTCLSVDRLKATIRRYSDHGAEHPPATK